MYKAMFLKARLFLSTLSLLRVLRPTFMETCNNDNDDCHIFNWRPWSLCNGTSGHQRQIRERVFCCSPFLSLLFRIMYRTVWSIVMCRRVLNFLKIKLVVFVKMEARQYLFLLRVSVPLGTKAHVVKVRRV